MNLILLILFIAGQGFFSGMETGMVSARRPRAAHAAAHGSRTAGIMLFFLDRPGLMISTTLLGVNICVVGASLSAKALAEQWGFHTPEGLLVCTACLSILMLSCEIVPKNWFRQRPDERCSRFVAVLYATYFLLYFPVRLFNAFTGFLERTMSRGGNTASLKNAVLREDLRLYLHESEADGRMDSGAAGVLDRAVALHDRRIDSVMIPMEKASSVAADATVLDAAEVCRRGGFLHIPVISSGNPKKCESVFSYYKAIFDLPESEWSVRKVSDAVEQAVVFRPDTGIPEAFNTARLSSAPMFFVEENGVTLGLVTRSMMVKLLF